MPPVPPHLFEAVVCLPDLTGKRLTIRADASPAIGTGHVMRCLALAKAWRDAGGDVTLLARELPEGLAERYRGEGCALQALKSDRPEDVGVGSDLTLLDGWQFDSDYIAKVRGLKLVIDDKADRPSFPCQFLLNPNLHATESLYSGRTEATLLAGPGYALLRSDYASPKLNSRKVQGSVQRILVLMGGADPDQHSEKALGAALAVSERLPQAPLVTLVVGAANLRRPALQDLVDKASGQAELLYDVKDMADLLSSADIAVSSAASTALELARVGTPSVLGALNESEDGPGRALMEIGAADFVRRFSDITRDQLAGRLADLCLDVRKRRIMSWVGQQLVDGNGTRRVLVAVSGAL